MSDHSNSESNLKELQELRQEVLRLKEVENEKDSLIVNLEEKLRQFESNSDEGSLVKYQSLFENSPMAIFRTNARTGEILYASPMVWKILGCEPQEGASTLNFYANPEDRANLLKDLMEHGRVEDREILVKKADGNTIWATFSVIYYPQENAVEGVMMDISKIKDSLMELQKVNYELDNFVYHASHDLRAPLRSIIGLINLLRMEKTDSGKEHCLEMIEGSIKRLDNLVIDLLQISRGSRTNNSTDYISLITEVNNSITNFYHVDDSESIQIITKIKQPVDFVSDLTRVRIVLNNLISNAIKYRRTDQEQSKIIIEATVSEEHAIIRVEDNGQGIPESKLKAIFEMFVRATDNNQGSGLGLYIVKNVVEKLGGKINVESEEGSGSVFTLKLPNMAS